MAGSLYGCVWPTALSPMMVYVDGIVSFVSSCDVPRHVPPAQICVQCEITESVPAAFAVPVHVPAISASASVAGAGAIAEESVLGVSDFAQANTSNGISIN